jgi:hypothetical protein
MRYTHRVPDPPPALPHISSTFQRICQMRDNISTQMIKNLLKKKPPEK